MPAPVSAAAPLKSRRKAKAKRRGKQGTQWQGSLPVVNPHAAGIDVAASSDLWAAIAPAEGRAAKETIRAFAPTTGGLRKLADWLAKESITTVAFEATGIYWLPLYHLLSERGFQIVVVNPRDTKALRKKTDIADAQWLQYLHGTGLLKASFVPPAEILGMRGVWRYRDDLVRQAGSQVQHMQKALDEMNIK
ncbi:MAG: transposase, partial [Verrucomicrobiota bacterium]|nr:transposase [Verrucomicrobiota bacterium]